MSCPTAREFLDYDVGFGAEGAADSAQSKVAHFSAAGGEDDIAGSAYEAGADSAIIGKPECMLSAARQGWR